MMTIKQGIPRLLRQKRKRPRIKRISVKKVSECARIVFTISP